MAVSCDFTVEGHSPQFSQLSGSVTGLVPPLTFILTAASQEGSRVFSVSPERKLVSKNPEKLRNLFGPNL